jgi:hypothetical protein
MTVGESEMIRPQSLTVPNIAHHLDNRASLFVTDHQASGDAADGSVHAVPGASDGGPSAFICAVNSRIRVSVCSDGLSVNAPLSFIAAISAMMAA